MKKSDRSQPGFTVMEMCVVIAIIAIIAAVGIPAFIGMRARYQLRSTATDILSVLKKARSDAIKQNAPVAVTFTATTYKVFLDNGSASTHLGNKTQDSDESNNTLDTGTLQGGDTLSSYNFGGTQPDAVEFSSSGLASSKDGAGNDVNSNGSVIIKGSSGISTQYKITVNIGGTAVLESSTDNGANFY